MHHHTFTCAKKRKFITIKETEGHGRLDNINKGPRLSNIPVCRFKFPKFPLDRTTLILGMKKDLDDKLVQERRNDLNKIIKFLIRQTFQDYSMNDSEVPHLKSMKFDEFLFEVGMFRSNKFFEHMSHIEKEEARKRYLNAISSSIQGTAIIVLKREVKDIFINAYNKQVMNLFKSNMDLQICIDPYAAGQYILNYVNKAEAGTTKLARAINEETTSLKQIEKLHALASVLDKNREVSIQEAIYRLMGLQMTRTSIKVKYVSTVHPHFRDGLLKGNIEDLKENESVFHLSAHQYYENRPEISNDLEYIKYDELELKKDYWKDLSLAEFWSNYEIAYGQKPPKKGKIKSNLIPLKNDKGFIRRRSKMAVLRYYLPHDNDEDLARGLLILFFPFRNELEDIHTKDVKNLLKQNLEMIEEKRTLFEKYKLMSDLISSIQTDIESENPVVEDSEREEDIEQEIETTSLEDIEQFNKYAKAQATKDLSRFKDLISVCNIEELRLNISSLNFQQRRIFDDLLERCSSNDCNERPVYIFIAGNAGTGKSYLVKTMIEAIKYVKLKPGCELNKPPLIVMAPTASAAFIIGGKTIDSALGFFPTDQNKYTQATPGKMAMMKHQFEDLSHIFCDEISMVGSKKLLKINYRLQDLFGGSRQHQYMGGVTFIASGNRMMNLN